MGPSVNLLNLGLMALIAVTVVASLKTVWVVLALALPIIPGATADLLVPQLHQVMPWQSVWASFQVSAISQLLVQTTFRVGDRVGGVWVVCPRLAV